MRNLQEFTCENFALGFILVACAFSAPALPDSPASLPAQPVATAPVALLDVRDRIETIDQAGLYVLLDRLGWPDYHDLPVLSPSPLDVYSDPKSFRGKVLRYNILLHSRLEPVSLARPTKPPEIYYVTAKIPFANDRQMPAIILLRDRPEPFAVDRATVTGYFYMVLRQVTQKLPADAGPDILDFLVIVAVSLVPSGSEITCNSSDSFRSFRFSLLGLGGLLAVWLVLKRKTTVSDNMGLPKVLKRRSL